ncbi:MAG: phosphoglucosamine mutase, partial [Bacillota bacterium]
RGVANRDLQPELAFALGRAAAFVLTRGKQNARMVIGRDTRVSGEMLEAALVAGITSAGVQAERLGVIPTPGVAYLVRKLGADAGVMISASHNPVPDNGIKFFSGDGFKLPDEVEDEIEALLYSEKLPRPTGIEVGRVVDRTDATELYIEFLKSTIYQSLAGLKIVVDCGFGAAYRVAPETYRALGAEVVALNAENDGTRINVGCGSTHPEMLQEAVKAHKANLGIAHDGDADRIIAVDETGALVDGDRIMAICGLDRLERGQLPKQTIAVTVYSNLGLHEAFHQAGGKVKVTANGDRYVLEAMRENGLVLGGEQSGHIIFLEHNTTGDGVLTALQLLEVMARKGKPLSELAQVMRCFPQVLRNVPVRTKEGWEANPRISAAIAKAEELLAAKGRIFVRPSGTEQLIRVMAEGPEAELLERIVADVAGAIQEELGN